MDDPKDAIVTTGDIDDNTTEQVGSTEPETTTEATVQTEHIEPEPETAAEELEPSGAETESEDNREVGEPGTDGSNTGGGSTDEPDGRGNLHPVEPVVGSHSVDILPALNMDGHRNRFVNQRGDMTILDDDTARIFYEEPKLYSYTYDSGTGDSAHVSTLYWCDENGNRTGGVLGEKYSEVI